MSKLERFRLFLKKPIRAIQYAFGVCVLAFIIILAHGHDPVTFYSIAKGAAWVIGCLFAVGIILITLDLLWRLILVPFAFIGGVMEYNRHRKAQLIAHYLRNQP